MFDANGIICTDIHKASLELFSPEEILKTSVCKITSTIVFDSDGPRKGGLHDPAMGPLDQRTPCITCGCRRDCPGHLGHIELPLPVFHPTLISTFVRLLKCICFRCRRLKIDPRTANVYIKKFQLIQNDMLSELEQFDLLQGKLQKEQTKERRLNDGPTTDVNAAKRVQLIKLFTKLQEKQKERQKEGGNLSTDISENHTAVETWATLRSAFFKAAMAKSNCAHCGRTFKTAIKAAPLGVGIDISWPWGSEKPFSKSTWRSMTNGPLEDGILNGGDSDIDDDDDDDDDENKMHSGRGRIVGSVQFQPYQMVNLMEGLWKSPDRSLLEFLYPMSIKNSWEIFFIRYLPVSANRFRPLMKASSFGGGSSEGTLHNRTSALLNTIGVVEKMSFALGVLRNPDPLAALMDPEMAKDPSGCPLPNITDADKERLRKIISQHQGNYKLLAAYSKELQEFVNTYIDSTKAGKTRQKVPPGVRQWMEKKQGAIRQKMMGKRVNFAARTVIAPDNYINTNEIGIPVEFAKKLTIAEYVTPQSASYLRQLIENGTELYPGANMIQDSDGSVYDLSVMDKTQRLGKARLLLANNTPGSPPKIVYRHVRDGDVVIMNRQPTLHRASMMSHFVKVLRGWKTFRLMYVNCGSYNADFDGDEMNMHLPQDPCSRAEAQLIVNADCHYITAKDGSPLRGLIQDHVLGGNFLTCRNSFLTQNQYYTLLYVGMGVFIDRGQKMYLESGIQRGRASNVAFSAYCGKTTGDPYFRVMCMENLPVKVEPPSILKPQKLWSGKQVITSVLKTVVDSVARARYDKDPDFHTSYKGINFSGKSKTPGDAWGGVLDGDKEESTLIIRDSELLQGVFDKSMFGASSYGLIHLCFELLGPSTAGMLLSIFARIFTTFLQIRGFSTCTGDFLMTPEGERNRERMIMHCTIAGNYLQEVFVDAINKTMRWKDALSNTNSSRQKYQAVQKALIEQEEILEDRQLNKPKFSGLFDRLHQRAELDKAIDLSCIPTHRPSLITTASTDGLNESRSPQTDVTDVVMVESEIPTTFGLNFTLASRHLNRLIGLEEKQIKDVESWSSRTFEDQLVSSQQVSKDYDSNIKKRDHSNVEITTVSAESKSETILQRKKELKSRTVAFNPYAVEESNLWNIARQLHSPMRNLDWRLKPPEKIIQHTKELIETLQLVGTQNRRLQRAILEALTTTPEIALYFPRVAQILGIGRLWGPGLKERLGQSTFQVPPFAPPGRIAPPRPNDEVVLPSGRIIQGDGSLRAPVLYHPSWVYNDDTGLPFEDTTRYATRIAEVKDAKDVEQYRLGIGSRPFYLRPNELTRLRLETLVRNHFAGREDALIRMSDGFFQSSMGKLTSKNNDLVSGKVTLYKFPFNGFASMITTGAKGSKVNFAMICGMLSQQSLEGKRVPVMVSGKTLPSFARYDLGARAGGLITDRYLTGLRPQEYFFHCMAGREGLVDTAVKTARSGYLQRCVMKGMEGVMVQYDGTVRDSDGTIVQFLYGEDGVDVSKASYSNNLEDLLQNPTIAKAKFWSEEKCNNPAVKESMNCVKSFLKEQRLLNQQLKENPNINIEIQRCVSPLDPISNVYPPTGYVGSVSERYRETVERILEEDARAFIKKTVESRRVLNGFNSNRNNPPTKEEVQEARNVLESLLLTKFSETLSVAGEAVGCLSAQSMGEPATQMTLNTFHLAGHGAANVTLGIPRLREILQTAGKAKTPILYIPIKGNTTAEAARNAEQVLMGFKRIPLTDVIHAIGVESNIYHQPENTKKGLPEYDLTLYKDNIDNALVPKFFWEYEVTIQYENLDHFCKVVTKFIPQKILALTMSRVVRDMMKQVNKLMFLYATKYAEEEMDSEDDELEDAAERYVFDRHTRSHFTKKEQRKERAKNAGVGFGAKSGGDISGEMDLLTAVDVAETYKRKIDKGEENEENDEKGEDKGEDGSNERDDNSDAMPDSDHSKDDSEEDFSESDMGDDAKEAEFASESEDGEQLQQDNEDMLNEEEKREMSERLLEREKKIADRRRLRTIKSKYKGINLVFDRVMRILQTERLIQPESEELEDDAMWSDTETAAWKVKPLPDEAFRFLTDVKVCRKTWRIVLKFGWPMERCPRRVTFLDIFVKIIKKYVLQETPGVRNPRVVGGDSTETGAMYEIQCEGSNFGWIQRLKDDCVDHNKVTSNDIRAILQFFGIEATRKVIVKEINKVFSVYGITVDYRHMSLIADAMTHSGISHHSSPFLQMSFETSMKFLTEAIERGAYDNLRTPAGSIVTGKLPLVGAGMCRILPKIQLGHSRKAKKDLMFSPELAIKEDINLKKEKDVKEETVAVATTTQIKLEHETDGHNDLFGEKRKRRSSEENQTRKKRPKFQFA